MTTPTLERFLDDVKNHQLTIVQNDGVSRHLKFANPNDCNKSFNITTFPNYLVITGNMGSLVFSRRYDMFDFFRDDNLNIYPEHWSENINSTSNKGKVASYSEFDINTAKKFAQDKLDKFLTMNEISEEDEQEIIEEFDNLILCSEDEYEIVEAIRNFNFKGFNFDEFSEDDFRVHTYRYIWLCYAIVWGIKKFDKVHKKLKRKNKQKRRKNKQKRKAKAK